MTNHWKSDDFQLINPWKQLNISELKGEYTELTCKVKIAKSIFTQLFVIISLSGVSLSGVK